MESNLALLASPLVDRANYLYPKELYICHAVDLRQFTEVLTFAPGFSGVSFILKVEIERNRRKGITNTPICLIQLPSVPSSGPRKIGYDSEIRERHKGLAAPIKSAP